MQGFSNWMPCQQNALIMIGIFFCELQNVIIQKVNILRVKKPKKNTRLVVRWLCYFMYAIEFAFKISLK